MGTTRGFPAVLAFFILASCAAAQGGPPDWYIPLRDAVYGQTLGADTILGIYQQTVQTAKTRLSGSALDVMLSRCEYFLGKAYQQDGLEKDAIRCYERGIDLAKKAAQVQPGDEAYEMLSVHYGQACMIKPLPWVMANGLKVERNAKKALEFNPRNAACQYMTASRWAFGPGAFGDPQRGVVELQRMLDGGADLQKDDYFNTYTGIAYACLRLEKKQEARNWVHKALELYPTNKFALDMLKQAG
ncbi:MAG: hypothetical protein LBS64_00080 [Spirochaetaceae bacterium]|jgi:tetratricopeptide (TPR) repeat protein|nr:hypothetical protein [Spirochaetaceae bacterium]